MKRKSKTKKFKVKDPLFTYNFIDENFIYNTVQKRLFSDSASQK
jgi:hypothetical protein